MGIPRQTSRWDERRNTSRVFAVPPDAVLNATRALERWRRENPEHARWIGDGFPTLTGNEHAARFGEPYAATRKRASAAAA